MDDAGQRLFAHEDVFKHYAYRSADVPGRACCHCCGHCPEPQVGQHFAKAFGAGGVADDGGVPEYFDDEDLDGDDLDDLDDEDRDESDEGSLADYHDKRIEEQELVEKLAEAGDALAFENAIMGLQVEQLAFRAAMRRAFG
jgi:hypothetical protein